MTTKSGSPTRHAPFWIWLHGCLQDSFPIQGLVLKSEIIQQKEKGPGKTQKQTFFGKTKWQRRFFYWSSTSSITSYLMVFNKSPSSRFHSDLCNKKIIVTSVAKSEWVRYHHVLSGCITVSCTFTTGYPCHACNMSGCCNSCQHPCHGRSPPIIYSGL